MTTKMYLLALLALALPAAAVAEVSATDQPATPQVSSTLNLKEDILQYGPFGNILVYSAREHPAHVLLFISGDGGFDKPFINMVNTVARPDTMVVAIDINTYLKNMGKSKITCMYAAADLEGLSQFVQTHYQYPGYTLPTVAGYSSGATMAYAALVQGPPNTFAGMISLGFCPDLESAAPFCKGSGLKNVISIAKDAKHTKSYVYARVSSTVTLFTTLQGEDDQVCPLVAAKTYMTGISNTSVIDLPKVGHGFLKGENWQAQFNKAFETIENREDQLEAAAHVKPQSLQDLPLVESSVASPKGKPLAVIVTGDGGWAGIDREIGGAMNAEGINVVGLNSLQYFWQAKTPDQAGRDLSRILAWYEAAWNPSSVVLIGYSRGAENLPFMVNRLPEAQKASIRAIAMLGAERKASFAFHVSDWLLSGEHSDDLPIKPEVLKLPEVPRLCFYGEDEAAESLCTTLDPKTFTIIKTPGGHHFGGDYKKLAAAILAKAK